MDHARWAGGGAPGRVRDRAGLHGGVADLRSKSFRLHAVATLAVWAMTLLIQRANRRDMALHAKLDELLRVDTEARSELTRLDEQEPEDIETHRDSEIRKAASDPEGAAPKNPARSAARQRRKS